MVLFYGMVLTDKNKSGDDTTKFSRIIFRTEEKQFTQDDERKYHVNSTILRRKLSSINYFVFFILETGRLGVALYKLPSSLV